MIKPQKSVVHVVFNMSAAGSLRQALQQSRLHQTVIGLPDDLSFGPIDPPAPDLREQWGRDTLGFDGFEDYRKHTELFWRQATDHDVTPVAWICRRSAMEFAGFLEFVWRIGDRPLRVVDITEIEFALRPDRSGPRTCRAQSFGFVPSDSIVEARPMDSQILLTEQELRAYRDLWSRLRAENAPLRVVSDLGLYSAPITHFDGVIASQVTNDWQKCARVVAESLGALVDAGHWCGDLVLWSRVRTLADEGVFEMKGDGKHMRESYVRRPGSSATA